MHEALVIASEFERLKARPTPVLLLLGSIPPTTYYCQTDETGLLTLEGDTWHVDNDTLYHDDSLGMTARQICCRGTHAVRKVARLKLHLILLAGSLPCSIQPDLGHSRSALP